MKKFSITKLEVARNDPSGFAKSLKPGGTEASSFFGRSMFIRWQDAINEFHRANDLSKAINYLEKTFSNYADSSKNRKAREGYLGSLDSYVSEIKRNGNIFLKKESLKITLNAKVMITGRVPLSFMNNKGGFSLYFFSKTSSGWEAELKFPIIQNYFSQEVFGTDLDKVEVGVFSIEDNRFLQQTYTSAEIEGAKKELKKIGKVIFDIL